MSRLRVLTAMSIILLVLAGLLQTACTPAEETGRPAAALPIRHVHPPPLHRRLW